MPAEISRGADQFVSVIMPAYNAEKFIPAAIESILAQTHPHFELLICNDGSTDATGEICDAYAAQDARIRVFHQPNRGNSVSQNRLYHEAQYDLVAQLDADDLMLPNRLERQLLFWRENPGLLFASTFAYFIDEHDRVIGEQTNPYTTRQVIDSVLDAGGLIWVSNTAILCERQGFLEAGGFPEDLQAAMDTYLWNLLAQQGPFLVQPEYLVGYRIHGKSVSVSNRIIQMQSYDWVRQRLQARWAAQPEPTFEQFLAQQRARPLAQRFREFLHVRSAAWYKQAVLAWALGRKVTFLWYGLLSFLAWPPYVPGRLANRRLRFAKGSLARPLGGNIDEES